MARLCRAWALASLCLLACTPVLAQRQDCYGASIEVQLLGGAQGSPALFTAYGYPSALGRAFHHGDPDLGPLALHLAPGNGSACAGLAPSPDPGRTVLLAHRGGCEFLSKAKAAAAAGHAALVLLDDQPGCVYMDSNDTRTASALPLHGVTLSRLAGERLQAAAGSPWLPGNAVPSLGMNSNATPGTKSTLFLLIRVPEPRGMDFAAPLLFALAVGCVAGGAALAAHAQRAVRAKRPPAAFAAVAAAGTGDVIIDRRGAWAFVGGASAALLALFFLAGWVLELVLAGVFAVGAWQPLTMLLEEGLAVAARMLAATRGSSAPDPATATATAWRGRAAQTAAGGVCVAWLLARDTTTWAWAPQDVMGSALLLFLLGTCLLPDLATACVLLPLAFAYDVWWVFLQPLVTHGPSVMVEVAAGGGQGPRLPMVLLAPLPGPGDNPGMAVLGLGDVALPGLLVAMLARWDVASGPGRSLSRSYAVPAVAAYAVGLALTYAALHWSWFGGGGQPALLYLVPCTLGTTLVLSAARGELAALWNAELLHESLADEREASDPDEPEVETCLLSRV